MDNKRKVFLEENFSNYFNKKEIIATCNIIIASRNNISEQDYNELYERELSIFNHKRRRRLELYLTLYLMDENNDYSYIYLTNDQITEIYGK